MNLKILLPCSYDIFNNHDDIKNNNKILDYVKIIILIDKKIGYNIDILDRINLFDTTISINNIDEKIINLDKILSNLIKKHKNICETKDNKNIYNNIIYCHRYIINYIIKYNIIMNNNMIISNL